MLKVESYKKGIVLSTVFNVFNKGLVFLNGIVVAYYFTLQDGTDLFFYMYNSIIILGAFFTSMNSSVIIPESMRIRTQKSEADAMKFLNVFVYAYITIIALAIALIALEPSSFFSVVSNFNKHQLQNHLSLLYLSLPLFGMICVISLLIDILASHKFFTISMIVGIINGLCSISFIVCFHRILGIQAVFYGLIISYLISLLTLLYLMKRYLSWQFKTMRPAIETRVWKNLGLAQMANLTSTVSAYMPIYILSGFNAGLITALTFAQQISSLPNALVINQFSSVAGIKFNELYSGSRFANINTVFSDAANFLHFLMIPISCFIYYYADELVQILLGFTSINKDVSGYISVFIRYLGFLLPLFVSNTLIARLFMASHKIKESFWYQVVLNLILITAIYFAVHRFGVIAYPFALIAVYLLSMLLYYFIEKHYFNFIRYDRILKNFLLFMIVNAIISTVVFYLVKELNLHGSLSVVLIAFLIYSLLLLLANQVLKMNNIVSLQVQTLAARIKNR